MADIKQCDLCRTPFVTVGSKICNDCLNQMELDLVRIREYLYEHPGRVGIAELAAATDIPRKVINIMIDTGRIEMKGGMEPNVCQKCGKPVSAGTMCDVCRNKVAEALDKTIAKAQTADRGTRPRSSKDDDDPLMGKKVRQF